MYDHLYDSDKSGLCRQTMRLTQITLTIRSVSDLLTLKKCAPQLAQTSLAQLRDMIQPGVPFELGEYLRSQGQTMASNLEAAGIPFATRDYETVEVTPMHLEDGSFFEIEDAAENERVTQEMIRRGCFVDDFVTE